MRARLSRAVITFINLAAIAVFIIGLFLSNFTNQVWSGIICQIISLLYTVIFGFLSMAPYTAVTDCPTLYFTDRRAILDYIIERLFEIVCNHSHEQIITIKYEKSEGVGKTELLRKVRQILVSDPSAKECLSVPVYSKYKKVRRKLGLVHFVTYRDEHTPSDILQLPYVLFKRNIVLVDDLPPLAHNPFSEQFLIICCQPLKGETDVPVKLERFSKQDIKTMYRAKFQDEIDEVFLQRIFDYTQGNVALVSDIFHSREVCAAYQREMPELYLLYSYIDSGKYEAADVQLKALGKSNNQLLLQNEDYQYRLKFIRYDLFHFKNQYQQALIGFEALQTEHLHNTVRYTEIRERLSHISNHMGHFDDALVYADSLPEIQRRKYRLCIKLLSYPISGNEDCLQEAQRLFCEMEAYKEQYITAQKDSYHTYQAVLMIYAYKFDAAHRAIDKAIALYEELGSKFLTNCYFIKGEIYRHSGNHDQACEYYQKCLNTVRLNGDFDVYSLAVSLLLYEIRIHGSIHNFDQDQSVDAIKERCIDYEMKYNCKIVMKLDELLKRQAELPQNESEYKKLNQFFEHYVFFIP